MTLVTSSSSCHSGAPSREVSTILDGIRSDHTVFVGSACGQPQTLVDYLLAEHDRWDGLQILTGLQGDAAPFVNPMYARSLRLLTLMANAAAAPAIGDGRADHVPSSLFATERLIRSGHLPVDVAFVQVAPPDARGQCSLGAYVGYARAAIDAARVVVAEVNEAMPRTHGASCVPVDRFACTVAVDRPLLTVPPRRPSLPTTSIAEHVARLVDDGDVLHVGVGSVAGAIQAALADHRGLRLHTGSVGDGVVDLLEAGVLSAGSGAGGHSASPVVAGQLTGTRRLFEYADRNPALWIDEPSTTHNPAVLARHERFLSINSAVEVDLRGQVNAETLGGLQVAGVGGAIDYATGARLSPRGLSIIALRSSTRDGTSRIVPRLPDGVVTLPASMVDVVVTENGVADLRGVGLRDRAHALLEVADEGAREWLEESLDSRRHLPVPSRDAGGSDE